MSYVEFSFFIYLCFSISMYFLSPKVCRKYILLLTSIIFYLFTGFNHSLFVFVTLLSTFFIAQIIESNHKHKKLLLILTVLFNIGMLGVVKYGDFTLSIIEKLLGVSEHKEISFLMPIGISFYTLQALSYLIDVKRKTIKAERNIFKYASFLLFFPTIIQGPITRYKDMGNQIWKNHLFDYERVKFGGQLVVWGLIKKLVIANRLGIVVDTVFNNSIEFSGITVLFACICYSFQIYTDFSGCVDICRGVSQMYGITLTKNFDTPYFATSIKDFWRRWHISLSTWFRDYIYIPLGGNKKGIIMKYCNLLIVFFVSGIWHGVGYHYIVWGLIHGLYQIFGDVWLKIKMKIIPNYRKFANSKVYTVWSMCITFGLVTFAWIFFRAPNTQAAVSILLSIQENFFEIPPLSSIGIEKIEFILIIITLIMLLLVSLLQRRVHIRKSISKMPIIIRWPIYLVALFLIIICGVYGSGYDASSFIYMQF